MTIVGRTGGHEIGGQLVFVLEDETIGPIGSETVVLDAAAIGPYAARGTLENWQAGVGTLAAGHGLPILAVSAALAGPLLHLAGQEGGGLHFYGGSVDRQNDTATSGRVGLGAWRITGLCSSVDFNRQRSRRFGRQRYGYGADP
ncbi:MAG: hypothetical protein USCAAHI_02312 [Beijerinckiaceae bacterium]|nr:MAG: hypothetical protein USCAAHI_02312 [Beijerinckiaceae bacterium]